MKIVAPRSTVETRIGETFGIVREGLETSGYNVEVITPPSIERLPPERSKATGFGGSAQVVERFRCRKSGTFSIEIVEGRSFEDTARRMITFVRCR